MFQVGYIFYHYLRSLYAFKLTNLPIISRSVESGSISTTILSVVESSKVKCFGLYNDIGVLMCCVRPSNRPESVELELSYARSENVTVIGDEIYRTSRQSFFSSVDKTSINVGHICLITSFFKERLLSWSCSLYLPMVRFTLSWLILGKEEVWPIMMLRSYGLFMWNLTQSFLFYSIDSLTGSPNGYV